MTANGSAETTSADDASQLVELARKHFESLGGISPAEEKLFRGAADGTGAWLLPIVDDRRQEELASHLSEEVGARQAAEPAPTPAEELKPFLPAYAHTWTEDRVVRADRIAWLCTDRQAAKLVSHHGVRLAGARIEGALDLSHARIPFPLWIHTTSLANIIGLGSAHLPELSFQGTHTRGIIADALKVEGGVFLRNGFRAEGEVRLLGASIGGDLSCVGGQFINPAGKALNATRLKVGGNVSFREGFRADGEVRLLGASIGGDLECVGGQFINPGGDALCADGLKVGGNVFLSERFEADGRVSLPGTSIGHLLWRAVRGPAKAILDLRSARVGTLWDEAASWPRAGSLLLHGLEYGEIVAEAPTDASSRLEWLRRQPQENGKFSPQPYEQLATVLREQGHEEDARQVLIGKNEDQAKYAEMPRINRVGHWVLGKTIAYGYRPWRAFYLSLIVIAIGLGVFSFARHAGLMRPTAEKKEAVESFNAAMYSVDVFLPVVDFHQEGAWRPDTATCLGQLVRCYLWLHITLGWVLTTLWVAGLSGLVKR